MQLSQLIELARAGAVESLELISLEGGFYLLEIREVGGVRHRLRDEAERVWHVRSALLPVACIGARRNVRPSGNGW